MKIYRVLCRFYGKTIQNTFIAKDEAAAKKYMMDKIEFIRVYPLGDVPDADIEPNNILLSLVNHGTDTNQTK